jgi:hypothetical protein
MLANIKSTLKLHIADFFDREALLKGKAKYILPPCATKFTTAPFNIAKLKKTLKKYTSADFFDREALLKGKA